MHYYIDGYNLLFRLTSSKDKLQDERQALIQDLNKKISVLKFNVSLVFDATFQIGDRHRSHFDALEILFTAYGETADRYILDELFHLKNTPQTVVTSDKHLAWKAHHLGAHTESVEEFFKRLNRLYHKKKNVSENLKKKEFLSSVRVTSLPTLLPVENFSQEKLSSSCCDDYLQVFEEKWQVLNQEQEKIKEQKKNKKKATRQPRQPLLPFQSSPPLQIKTKTEEERWLKIFEASESYPPQFPNS